MKDDIINDRSEKLIQLYNQDRWREVLALLEGEFYDERFLWVRPTLENLSFIGREVGSSLLVSVGCGSGLLEWLIMRATGVDVIGLEVDRSWWESGYAPPNFLPLHFTDEVLGTSLHGSSSHINGTNLRTNSSITQINSSRAHMNGTDPHVNGTNPHINGASAHINGTKPNIVNGSNATLMFCYFNNRPAFKDYVQGYEGSCIIIVGPAKGQGAHTDPEPFDAKLSSDWSITQTQPMPVTGDYIVVYRR